MDSGFGGRHSDDLCVSLALGLTKFSSAIFGQKQSNGLVVYGGGGGGGALTGIRKQLAELRILIWLFYYTFRIMVTLTFNISFRRFVLIVALQRGRVLAFLRLSPTPLPLSATITLALQ